MKTTQKQALIAAISTAISAELKSDAILSNKGYANFKPMKEDDGRYTVHIAPELKVEIEYIEGFDYNLVDASFEISFNRCTYDEKEKCYQWDGKNYEVSYGDFETNILFGSGNAADAKCSSNTWECEGIADISSEEDDFIARSAFQAAFDTMSTDEVDQIAIAIFEKTKRSTDAPDAT